MGAPQRKVFHFLVDIEDALRAIYEKAGPGPLGEEKVPLLEAHGRVLSRDIYAPIDHPPFDRSEVDGYAVRSEDVEWADELSPVALKVSGKAEVGKLPGTELREGEALEISTGAPLPRGADAIVMEEYCEREGDVVLAHRSASPGENVSTGGSDISAGDLLIPKGTRLRHYHIGLLAGMGFRSVYVYRRPRAVVFSTGAEVVEPGAELPPGKVYDVNGHLITTFLREMGAEADFAGVLPDDTDVVRSAIARALEEYDVIITSGGTSAGEADVIYRVFQELGEVIVHGLKVKPGKPTVIAHKGRKLLIGLPGFPMSSYMILTRLVKPVLTKLIGAVEHEDKVKARLPFPIRKQAGKAWVMPVSLINVRGEYTAYPISLASGSISHLIYSDGLIVIPVDRDYVEHSEEFDVYLFKGEPPRDRLTFIGSNDPFLMEMLRASGLLYRSRVINAGSYAGWVAISRGEADIAPTHLLDEETLQYNITYLDKMGLRGRAALIRGYKRVIGLVVKKDNPKGIRGLGDFLRDDIRIVNRVKGSGIRAFIDYNLRKIFEERSLDWKKVHRIVNGYTYEVRTHTAVALAVSQGRADVGIASGYAAEIFGLDFIPLAKEDYDFLTLKERIEKREVREFIEILRNRKFVEELLSKLSKYYEIPPDIGELVE